MTTHPDRWLTIREAALALGMSDLSVRRRIKDGRLAHRLENGKYYVNLGLPAPAQPAETRQPTTQLPTHAADQAEQTAPPAGNGASRSIDPANLLPNYARLAEQAGRASALEDQLRALEERYATLQEGVVSLASRNGWLESKLDERDSEIKLLTDTRKRPWWKRLFGTGR